MQLSTLIRGPSGHPSHPPLTDATIGMFVLAAGIAIVGAFGGLGDAAGKAMWLALIGGLIVAAPTALTGFADWLTLEWGSRKWRTATFHALSMVSSVILFAIAAWLQWSGWKDGGVTSGGLVLTLVGTGTLLFGGWLGGSLVFVHGMRVLEQEQASREQTAPERETQPSGRVATGGGSQ